MKSVKLNLLIAVGLVLLLSVPSQSQFVKTLGGASGEDGRSVVQTSDGGLVVAGWTDSFGAGGGDLLLSKFDAFGNHVWSRTLGGASDDGAFSVIQTSDSGLVVTGRTDSFGAGGGDLYLSKFDASGNHLWSRTLGGTSDEYGLSVVQTSDGGLVVTGLTASFGAGGGDFLLSKFDASGNPLWSRALGGSSGEVGHSVVQTSDGGFVVTGNTTSFGAGAFDLLLSKFDASGTHLWSRTLGGTSADAGYSVVQTSDGGFVVTGNTGSFGAGNGDLLLSKFNASGNPLWSRTLGGTSAEYGYSVVQTSDGGLVVTGVTGSFPYYDLLLSKFDASGNWLWSRTLGGTSDDDGYSVVQTSDGGLVVAGYTGSFGVGGDILLSKFYFSGNTCLGQFITPTVDSIYPVITIPPVIVTPFSPIITIPNDTVTSPALMTTTVCVEYQFIRGDVDGDGLVGFLDPFFIVCMYGGGPMASCWDAADANDDGKVDASDYVYLVNYLFSLPGSHPPPPPFPDPGFDPTPDALDCANPCVAPTPSNLDSLIVPSVSGFAGDTITVPIIVRNSQDLLAYQLHLEFDPNILQVTEVLNTGVANPKDFGVDTLSPGVVNIWCYIDCLRLRSIPAGRDTLVMVKIILQVNDSCATTLLDLKTVTGPPFWGNLFDYSGGKVYPTIVRLKCGDVNGDGVVNVSDVVYLINCQFVSGSPCPKPMAAGDVTCDGAVNISDVVYLINYLFVSGSPPPCGS